MAARVARAVIAPAALQWYRSRKVLAAIALSYGFRLTAAWLLAAPFVDLVRASGLSNFPEGDSLLVMPGGWYLLELLWQEHAGLLAATATASGLLIAFSLASLWPEYFLLAALAPNDTVPRRPASAVPRLVALGIGVWITRAALGVATLTSALGARGWFSGADDERIADLAFLVVLLGGAALQLLLSVLRDLAYASLVALPVELAVAPGVAFISLQRARGPLLARFGAALLATLGALIVAAWCVGQLHLETPGALRATGSFAVHQLAVLCAVGLRAAWLRSALQAVRGPDRDGSGRAAHAEAFL
jgi:hypothetical protein